MTKLGTNNSDGFMLMAIFRTNSNFEPVYKIESFNTAKSEGDAIPVDDSSICQTFGLNYYPNDWTRLQLNYIDKAESPTEINNDDLLLQLQVRF